jgi:hypothetical protein
VWNWTDGEISAILGKATGMPMNRGSLGVGLDRLVRRYLICVLFHLRLLREATDLLMDR